MPESQIRQRKKRFIQGIIFLLTQVKKLLYSDWLGAVQFKFNISAKTVSPMQMTRRDSGL